MPRRRHPPRFAIALCAVLAVLWAQLALASMVCAGMAPQGAEAADAGHRMATKMDTDMDMATDMALADAQPCHGVAAEPVPPALCHGHCAGMGTTQSVEAAVKLPTPSLPTVLLAWPLPLPPAMLGWHALEAAGPRWRHGDAPAHPPPTAVFLATRRLRV